MIKLSIILFTVGVHLEIFSLEGGHGYWRVVPIYFDITHNSQYVKVLIDLKVFGRGCIMHRRER